MQILTGLKKEPAALVFSPDGRYLAAGDGRTHHLWELAAGAALLWSHRHFGNPRTLCFSPDGESVACRWSDKDFHRYDTRTGAGWDDDPLSALNPFLFSPDGRTAVGSAGQWRPGVDGLWCARATAGGGWAEAWRREFPRDGSRLWAFRVLMFSADSARLARVFRVGELRRVTRMGVELFAVATGEPVAQWEGELPGDAHGWAYSSTGVVALLHARSFYALDPTDPQARPVKCQNASPQHFTAAAFSPDGTRLATTSNDTAATIWDATTWEVRKRYEWDIGRLRTVCFAPDGLRCAAAGDKGQIVVWDLDD